MSASRVALVTGASRGLGREIAVALASSAGAVLVHYFRNRRGAEATARAVRRAGAESDVLQADVTVEKEARGLIAAVEKGRGRLDILVNNVGPILFRPWDELTAADWESMFRQNLLGAYFCLSEALPGMRARRFGRIVNLGFGRVEQLAAFPTVLPYAAAKTGLLLLTRTAAAECRGTGVTVNMVSPGLLEGGIRPAGARVPRRELGTYAEVAAAVRFLAAEEARRVTGTDILVAGTWKM
ncbi:MAG TPA: SDR family NAD(P)-dependent oxidoreductase [Candidatus Aminicenantes bacterium]|nr:SDR family NAD(P)-dependent oxidoreductase [Candidatus Aminicenantes bacterium]